MPPLYVRGIPGAKTRQNRMAHGNILLVDGVPGFRTALIKQGAVMTNTANPASAMEELLRAARSFKNQANELMLPSAIL